jgi:Tfp pilus assembly protein PilX
VPDGLIEMLRRRLQLARDERGIALVVAVGTLFVLAVMATTVLEFSSASARSSRHSDATQKGLSLAEAGLNEGIAALAASPLTFTGASTPVSGYAPATVTYSGTLSGSVWTITGTATGPSGNDGVNVTRTVSQQVQATSTGLTGNEAWDYVFANNPGCTYFQNEVVISAPVYTKGDLCLKNRARLLGSRVDSYGLIQIENEFDNDGKVGYPFSDSSDPVVRTRLGCRLGGSGGGNLACADSTYKVWRSSFSNAVPSYPKPPFEPSYRSTADLGPLSGCTTSTGTVPSFIFSGNIDLMPGSSYTCQKKDVSNNVIAELSWDDVAKVLTIKGTIWFDGFLLLDGTQQGSYDGKATIYFDKHINIKDSAQLCAIPGCPLTGWDPNLELLVLVVASPAVPAFEVQNFAKVQGAAFAVGGFKIQNDATFHGPVVADVIDALNNGFPAGWPPLTSLLDGMPQNPTAPTITLVGNSWRG